MSRVNSLDKRKLVFLLQLLVIFPSLDANIFPASSLYINSGEGFVIRLNLDPSFDLRECRLVYDVVEVIQLSIDSVSTEVTSNSETLESLGSGECGVRVHNVSSASSKYWSLEADSMEGSTKVALGTLLLNILSSVPEVSIAYESGAASSFGTIHCPGDYNQQRYCEITNPQGKVIEGCELKVKFPALSQEKATYLCKVFYWGRMDSVDSEVHVRSHEDIPKVVSKIEETETHVTLSCSFDESLSICRAESLSTANQFLIMDGFQSRRYSTRNTVLESGLCQFEIPTPIAANETGVWRIHGRLKSSSAWAGCLFHVNVDLNVVYEAFKRGLDDNNAVPIITTTSERMEIRCADVPYALEYCYLVTPTKELIRPTPRELKLFRAYGRCTFSRVESVTGRYTCGFNSLDHTADLLHHFDVQYNDPSVFVAVQQEVVTVDDPTKPISLLCFALQDYSIDSCSFMAPSGDVFYLPNSVYAHTGYAYFGRGFEEGECGIQLAQVERSYMGNWTCSVNLVDRTFQYDVRIMVREAQEEEEVLKSSDNLSVAAISGIAFAGVVVIAVLIGCVIYMQRRRRNRARNADIATE